MWGLPLCGDVFGRVIGLSGQGPAGPVGALMRVLTGLLVVLLLVVSPAWAEQPTPDTQIGETVTDPVSGEDATVTDLVQDEETGKTIAVITDAGRLIYTTTAVGDVFPAEDEDGDWTITVADPDEDTGFIDEVTMERTVVTDPGPPEVTEVETQTLVVAETYAASDPVDEDGNPISPEGTPGDPETTIDPPPPAEGDSNYIYVKRIGADGDDGRDGYGVRFCILKRCWTVAYAPKPGEDGSTGPTIKINVPSDVSSDNIPSATYPFPRYSLITTATDRRSGIKAISIGGDGGEGGDAYGNIDAENGGDAGNGGNITVNTDTEIRTSGERAPGVYTSSLAGVAGDGGTGYIGSYGGDSGDSAKGGTIRVTNSANGLISTTGNGSHGIFALSSGGAAGDGGDSWGIVGEAGSALKAGNGGSVYVTNRGDIVTDGEGSHGVLAQSIGGTGGDGGSAGGIVALGGDGSEGGNGGFVKVTTDAGSRIETLEIASHGILAESIGGGGGNGGVGGGIVGIGAEGDGGGDGGGVSIVHNGSIETFSRRASAAVAAMPVSVPGSLGLAPKVQVAATAGP